MNRDSNFATTLEHLPNQDLPASARAQAPERLLRVSGVEAVARGAWEGGVEVATGYPGAPATGIVQALEALPGVSAEWAANEKVALEIAIGASLAGARAMTVMKHVGLNVACDPLHSIAYAGIRAGLVIAVGDDPGARSSQNEQDSRWLARSAGIPVLEPSNVEEARAFASEAFRISEATGLPVLLRLVTTICYAHDRIASNANTRPAPLAKELVRDLRKRLLVPAHVPDRHRWRDQELASLSRQNSSAGAVEIPVQGSDLPGIVCAGHAGAIVEENLGGIVPILRLTQVHPIPLAALHRFVRKVGRIVVVDEASDYLEASIRAAGFATLAKEPCDPSGPFRLEQLRIPEAPELDARIQEHAGTLAPPALQVATRLPGFCAGCPHTGIFHVLRELDCHVVGDIGCSTLGALAPFNALHSNLCMGASIGMIHGHLKALGPEASRSTVAVLGDSTFLHSGMPAISTLARSGSAATVFILDNAGSAMTGLQSTAASLKPREWKSLLQGLGVQDVEVVPSLHLGILRWQTMLCLEDRRLSVRVLQGPCVQERPHPDRATIYRYTVNQDACTSCGKCLDTNCPSFESDTAGGKLRVAITDACVGCGYCQQVCPDGAILPLSVHKALAVAPPLRRVAGKLPWYRIIRALRSNRILDRMFDRIEDLILSRTTNHTKQGAENV